MGRRPVKMAARKGAVSVTRQVRPLLSVDKNEARHRVLSLYRAWWRQIPYTVKDFDIPVSVEMARKTLRQRFEENANVKDIRVIDMLVVKGQQDLKEVVEHWAQPNHIMSKHFREGVVARPKDFMSKFLAGQD